MSIPFLNLFKRAKARRAKHVEEPRAAVLHAPAAEKPAAERLSKTVMPNATRTLTSTDPFRAAAKRITLREIGGTPVRPPGERAIRLSLGDLLPHLPAGSLKPRDTLDVKRTVAIKAAEAEKGMATGQPTALLASIYEQAPDIFRQSVAPTDTTQVSLPFDKVMEQFQTMHVRDDQMQDEAVPQVETPFLQVTIEDTEKFGTPLPPLQTSAKPPVKVEPATARSIAKAEPEPVAQEKQTPARRPISLTPPTEPVPPPSSDPAAGPTRIPFNLPPNGAGVPASERVPASSGPPVPTPPPAPAVTPAPARIPFKMPAPNLKPKLTLIRGVEEEAPSSNQPAAVTAPADQATATNEKIKLRLSVCLRNLPAFQLAGELPQISDDVLIELPYALVEPQLSTGRVAIYPKLFHSAIPEPFRDVFVVDAAQTAVLLPLQEVLQNLPSTALQMRQDQEQVEAIDHYETPFSHHAKEDQQRFDKPDVQPAEAAQSTALEPSPEPAQMEAAIPVERPPEEVAWKETSPTKKSRGKGRAAASPATTEQPEVAASATPAASTENEAVEAKSNAKEFVLKISCLPGVTGCSIAFADGLTMAGNLPPSLAADGLCAVAPSVLQKIEKHMVGSDLGSLNSMTLNCNKSLLSFFMEGNVCLTVLHSQQTLEPVTQEQLVQMTKELAQIFAQPETTHVDH